MQSLDVQNPGIPDLQFVLLVLALTTSDLDTLNLPGPVGKLFLIVAGCCSTKLLPQN